MDRILSQLKKEYKLNETDVFIAQYILEHSDEVIRMSTHQLAKCTFSSATAVVRFVKKIGFDNYNDFKINCHSFLNKYYLENMQILSNEGIFSLKNKLAEIETGIINQTRDLMDPDVFHKVMLQLSQNQYIDIIANDANACIAEYASHLLDTTGKIVTVYHNHDKQLWLSLNADRHHTVILISKYGKVRHFLDIADILTSRQIPFLVITSQHENALSRKSSMVLKGMIHDEFESLKAMVFYISLKYIFDLIYSVLISENMEKSKELDGLYSRLFRKSE